MKKNIWRIIILILPLILIIYLLLLRSFSFPVYQRVGAEDNLLEWGQFFLYLFSGILTILLAIKYKENKFLLVIYIILTLGLLFIAFEEISWGERIPFLPNIFALPTELMERNVQGEQNIHNIDSIHSIIGYIYIVLGFIGCFAWIGKRLIKKSTNIREAFKKTLNHIIPEWYYFFYFFPLFINLLSRNKYGFMPQDYEVAETCLALGVFLFFLQSYIKKKKGKWMILDSNQ